MRTLKDFLQNEFTCVIGCVVDAIIIDENSEESLLFTQNGLILEHNKYKTFGNTTLTYRIDKGDGTPGHQTHIHVYSKPGQLFAMNTDGTTHDGSKVQLSKKDQKILSDLGFQVPKDGILEWIEIDGKMLLLD